MSEKLKAERDKLAAHVEVQADMIAGLHDAANQWRVHSDALRKELAETKDLLQQRLNLDRRIGVRSIAINDWIEQVIKILSPEPGGERKV